MFICIGSLSVNKCKLLYKPPTVSYSFISFVVLHFIGIQNSMLSEEQNEII